MCAYTLDASFIVRDLELARSATPRTKTSSNDDDVFHPSRSGLVFEPRRGPLRRSRREVPDVRHERAVRVLEAHFIVPLEEYVVVRPVAGAVGRGSLRTKSEGRGGERFFAKKSFFGESASRPRPPNVVSRVFAS